MTERQFQARVKYWLKHPSMSHLGISHWQIEVRVLSKDEQMPGSDGALAAIKTSGDYDEAKLYVREDQVDGPLLRIDRLIVHELMHIVERDLMSGVRELFGHLAPGEAAIYDSQIEHEREGVIDRLSKALVVFEHAAN